MRRWMAIVGLILVVGAGCTGSRREARCSCEPPPCFAGLSQEQPRPVDHQAVVPAAVSTGNEGSAEGTVIPTSHKTGSHEIESQQRSVSLDPKVRHTSASSTGDQGTPMPSDESPRDQDLPPVTLEDVIVSVYRSYPLLEAAFYSRNVAAGEQLAAEGQFDLKLKAASENGPTGFYQTYRQSIGLVQPTLWGGELFGGYRIGRGDFEPWYLERQTNDGGEFKAGVVIPLARNRDIDVRRAALWRTEYGRQLVESEINAQLIGFVQEAGYAYWQWLAAGKRYRIVQQVLKLAEDRMARIKRQVEAGLIDPPELTDNQRLVAERRAKLADSRRKLQQAAIKLSIYLRHADGSPRLLSAEQVPDFPEPRPAGMEQLDSDIQLALANRPELEVLDWMQQQLQVDCAQARNEFQPAVDVAFAGSQDVGQPTSSKRDKSEFELEAALRVDVPMQRRKARGKMLAVQGKLAQLAAKRRLTEDKIAVDVRSAYAAIVAAREQLRQAREAVRLAEDLARRERRNFELGASDLLKVTLREQYAVESAEKEVDALLQYYRAQADYRAALAQDDITSE